MSVTEWVDTFLTSPADTVSLVIGLMMVAFVSGIAWYLGTVIAEGIIAVIERDR